MAKGSGFTRTVQYFRTADIAEARACLITCSGIVHDRTLEAEPQPKVRRTRRTKAQLVADANDSSNLAKGATA